MGGWWDGISLSYLQKNTPMTSLDTQREIIWLLIKNIKILMSNKTLVRN
jgi:hypothetical protein